MVPEFTLLPEEIKLLEEQQIFLGPLENGKRKVSSSILSPPSSQGSQGVFPSPHSSSSPSNAAIAGASASIRFRNFNPSTMTTINLPESSDSIACIEYLGYTRSKAEHILRIKQRAGEDHPDSLWDFAFGYLKYWPVWQLPIQDSPREIMTKLGLTEELQDTLLNFDPQFRQVFESQDLLFWMEDTMRLRWHALNKLHARLKEHASRTLAEHRKKPKITASIRRSGPRPLPEITFTPPSQTQDLPRGSVAVHDPPPILNDHYTLYSLANFGTIDRRYDPTREALFNDYGDFEVRKLDTDRGEFNVHRSGMTWTLERGTAEQFRKWAQHRSHHSETFIVRIQVPKAAIDGLRQEELWFSEDWKAYYWYLNNRNRRFRQEMPPRLDKYWKWNYYEYAGSPQLVKGHICAKGPSILPTPRIEMTDEEIQNSMTEDDVFMTNGQKATQWVLFLGHRPGEFLDLRELVRGKVYIDIHAGYQRE